MYELSKTAPFGVKTTEAMHYRRYVAQRIKAEHGVTENENASAARKAEMNLGSAG